MEDLLKEDEFFPKKDNYNPWRGFCVFYCVALVHFAGIFFMLEYINVTGALQKIISFILLSLVTTMPFTMIFHNKKNIHLPVKTILFSVSVLMTFYYVSHTLLDIFRGSASFYNWSYYLLSWFMMLIYGAFCSVIILLIRKVRLKKLSATPQSSSL